MLLDKVSQFLKSIAWGDEGTVVAVSGGPDSVALLLALCELQPASKIVITHLNHQLRGTESDADETFVRRLHEKIGAGVALRCERCDVAVIARATGGNVEDVARRLRYDWLAAVARDTGCRWVATGHTADDQAETVLHRLLRGSGLRGLRGIAARKALGAEVCLIRPLLHTTRTEVIDYLRSRNQDYCTDRSNLDRTFTRNRIRHELLPYLAEHYNPDIARLLCQLAEQAEAAYQVAASLARQLLADAELPRAGALLIFDRRVLGAAPRDVVREMFRLVWDREHWPEGDMTFDSWDRLASVAQGETTATDLPGGICARSNERVVQLGRAE